MFGDQFMLQSLYDEYNSNNNTLWDGKDNWLEHDTVHGWDAFYDKFFEISDSHHRESNHGDINCVFGWDNLTGDGKWEHEWKDVDHECDEILERFAAQDKDWNQFASRLGYFELPKLTFLNGGVNYRIAAPGAIVKDGKLNVNTNFPGVVFRYTVDGKEPTKASTEYKTPVSVTGDVIKIVAFNIKGRASLTTTVSIK